MRIARTIAIARRGPADASALLSAAPPRAQSEAVEATTNARMQATSRPPSSGGESGGRNVEATATAKTHPEDALGAEEATALIGEEIRAHLGDREPVEHRRRDATLADSLRLLLDERVFDALTLAEAGQILGASTPKLVRTFVEAFSISPHRYVVASRIEAARKRLLAGEPIADTACAVGFHDQAHFTRHFRRHVGETPGRFAQSSTRRV